MGQSRVVVPAQAVADNLIGVLLDDGRPLGIDRQGVNDLLLLIVKLVAQIVETGREGIVRLSA